MNLQDFSKQNFDPEKILDPFSDNFPKSRPGPSEMSEIGQKSTAGKVKYGLFWLFWVAVGPFGLEMVPYESKLV